MDPTTVVKSLSEPVEETEEFLKESEVCLKMFENWNEVEQVTFVENLLSRMCHYQHGQINTFLFQIQIFQAKQTDGWNWTDYTTKEMLNR